LWPSPKGEGFFVSERLFVALPQTEGLLMWTRAGRSRQLWGRKMRPPKKTWRKYVAHLCVRRIFVTPWFLYGP
jgi:hypothetical protein